MITSLKAPVIASTLAAALLLGACQPQTTANQPTGPSTPAATPDTTVAELPQDAPQGDMQQRAAFYREQLQPVGSRDTCAGPSVRIGIEFDYNSDQLTPAAQRELDALKFVLQEPVFSATPFEINGHTDAPGDDDYNLELSRRRAESVRRYLTSGTSMSSRLQACGYGEQFPKVKTDGANRSNRRVEISNLGCAFTAYPGCD